MICLICFSTSEYDRESILRTGRRTKKRSSLRDGRASLIAYVTPTFSICPKHGYLLGHHEFCPKCDAWASTKSQPPESGPRPIRLQPLQGPATEAPAVGGVVPSSSVDWPGQLAAVIFIAGCSWICRYCHDPHLQVRERRFDWRAVCAFLRSRRGLLDGIVFSGDEP
jgi:hypothetical protein